VHSLITIESRAVSLKPKPDVYLGWPERSDFLEALRHVSLQATVLVTPSDPRHSAYIRRARYNRTSGSSVSASNPPAAKAPNPGTILDGDFYTRASLAAFKIVSRHNLPWWAEQEDLVGLGCIAILESGAKDEPLARTVAHRAMVSYLKNQEVRQRDREWRPGSSLGDGTPSELDTDGIFDADGERYNPREPGGAGRDAALWELIKALPVRQHTAVRLRLEGYSTEEVAQQMVATPKAVERLLARARESMRKTLFRV
jgi:RNA polymerase sigma factor (sigma-70 family)